MRGRHVHLLSVRAQLGLRDRGYSAYCSTKGGLVMLVKQHAMELARHGITVNGPALLFCAPTGGFVTGQVLYIDGGVTASQ